MSVGLAVLPSRHNAHFPGKRLSPLNTHPLGKAFEPSSTAAPSSAEKAPASTDRFTPSAAFSPPVLSPFAALKALSISYPFVLYSRPRINAPRDAVVARVRLDCPPLGLVGHLAEKSIVAMGDLHGHYRKLVETLATGRFITMPETVAHEFVWQSEALERCLQQDPGLFRAASREEARRIQNQLLGLIAHFQWIGEDRQLLLIGDVLGDRGPLDSLTLAILAHIKRQKAFQSRQKGSVNPKPSFIFIASNHDHGTIRVLLDPKRWLTMGLNTQGSLHRAFRLLKAEEETPQALETQKQAEAGLTAQYRNYLMHSKLMHYNPKTGSLYTHASVSRRNIQKLMDTLGSQNLIKPEWRSLDTLKAEDLPDFIETVNRIYQWHVWECFTRGESPAKTSNAAKLDGAFLQFLWERDEDECLHQEEEAPFLKQGVKTLIHGHSWGVKEPFNLEGRLRRQQPVEKDDFLIVNLDDRTVRKGLNQPITARDRNLVFGE